MGHRWTEPLDAQESAVRLQGLEPPQAGVKHRSSALWGSDHLADVGTTAAHTDSSLQKGLEHHGGQSSSEALAVGAHC